MKDGPDTHHRRSIRLPGYDYSQPGAYYVTVCAHEKKHLFGEIIEGEMKPNQHAEVVRRVWEGLTRRYPAVQVDAFVVMPNHIHGVIVVGAVREPHEVGAIHELPQGEYQRAVHEPPLRRRMLLPIVLGYFKMQTSKRINEMRDTPGAPVWQRNYYEHVVRNEDELGKIREYIATNPLRWVRDPENAERETNLPERW